MATLFTVKFGKQQGDWDANDYTILNLDKTGLNLVKGDVGLGNVDNTSDLNKPLSTAAIAALAGKEPTIAAGTTEQFWRGDKTWANYGSLALEDGNTTKPLISVIGANSSSASVLQANRNDYLASHVATSITQRGASTPGLILAGVNAANTGGLEFDGTTFAIIKTNNAAPIIFGTNGQPRMRLSQGLNVGGPGDPGQGCITCYDTMTTGHLVGGDLHVDAGPGTGNAIIDGNATIGGAVAATGVISTASNLVAVGNMVVAGVIVNFANLPTLDPHVNGQLWRSTNDLKVSTG